MGNTWIVDLRHYLDPPGAFAYMPTPARLLAEYFASIVVNATANLDDEPSVRCRRRPGQRHCASIIMSYPSADELERIHWHCPVCMQRQRIHQRLAEHSLGRVRGNRERSLGDVNYALA